MSDVGNEVGGQGREDVGLDVLIVEDDPDIRELVAEMLTARGLRVAQAVDGIEALAAARASRPKVILTDLHMPRMNGAELARALRCTPPLDSIPVMTMTAADNMRRAPAGTAFSKPIDFDAMIAAIHAQLTLRRLR